MTDKIAVIGLGYVGLPLAVEFSKKYHTFGYDCKQDRIDSIKEGCDITGEVSKKNLSSSSLILTSKLDSIQSCNIYIIAVPTPIDTDNKPNLSALLNASTDVGKILSKNDIVIYESTVYPGCTEEKCVPILESISGLKFNSDFFCGYSPERINPGDKKRTLTKIVKVTSGSNKKTLKKVDALYKSIIDKGTFPVSSIKIAEAAKIIENCQRDINIAFVNELSMLFNLMKIDTKEVLEAAGTKWNFLPFTPGLVGGHCIGVDPYYLTYKAKKLGYESKIILSGRELNDSMADYVCTRIEKKFFENNVKIEKAKILLLGITFKENCTDSRNSKLIDIYDILINKGAEIDVYDPLAIQSELNQNKIILSSFTYVNKNKYDCIIVGVSHNEFKIINIKDLLRNNKSIVFDIKGTYKDKFERL